LTGPPEKQQTGASHDDNDRPHFKPVAVAEFCRHAHSHGVPSCPRAIEPNHQFLGPESYTMKGRLATDGEDFDRLIRIITQTGQTLLRYGRT
jgi:hypothetical protein